MIKKITELKNIGKFENYKSSDISFGKFVGIFADNGSGKSTLTNILRSFNDNNPNIIIGRKTIASGGNVSCKIETDTGFKKFSDNQWDQTESNILIFDANFVNQNIFSGMYVGIDHRRKLYQFILGEEAIHLNEQVNSIAQDIAKVTQEANEIKKELNKTIGKAIKLDDFLKLKQIDNINTVIEAKRKEVKALTNKEKVISKSLINKLPQINYSLELLKDLLKKTVKEVSSDSELKVKKHIEKCLTEEGEDWIKQGKTYSKQDESCPYCGTELKGNDLIKAYNDYFNKSYNQLKYDIDTEIESVNRSFNKGIAEKSKKVLSDNDVLVEFWDQYVSTSLLLEDPEQGDYFPILAEQDIQNFYDDVMEKLTVLIKKKHNAPLEDFSGDPLFDELSNLFDNHIKIITDYNNLVDSQNTLLKSYKEGLGSSNLQTEQQSLTLLEFTKERYIDENEKQCQSYLNKIKNKEDLVQKKEEAKNKLDTETQKIPEKYQSRINHYLERFGAEFRISDHKKVNPSGQSATEYKLVLRGTEIILGDNKTPEDVTSFQNTLSEGDKSTLAFSYFLARLDSETNLENKVLVFDDPISSLDRFRRSWTRSILKQFGLKAKQLIVLSHEPSFVEDLAHTLRATDFKCYSINWDSERNSSVIAPAEIKELNRNDYIRNLEKVKNYLKANIGNPEDIKARLRHLLEHYIRNKYPQSFFKKDNLGNMIRTIRESDTDDEYNSENENLHDLDAINEYSIDENHSQDGDSGPIDSKELTAMSKLVFKIIDEPDPTEQS